MLLFKFIIGLLLLPVCWVSVETFFLLFKQEALSGSFYRSPEFFFFAAGAFISLVVFLIAKSSKVLMWFYVAGHEYTHALFALIFRGKVREVKISSSGGHVKTNRNNFIISLSPYFFPFYTILVILVWGIADRFFYDFTDRDIFWLYGAIGFSWMFHIAYTVMILQTKQSDIDINGKLFSFSVILLINVLLISVLLIIASPHASFRDFGLAWARNLDTFGHRLMESLGEIYRFLPG